MQAETIATNFYSEEGCSVKRSQINAVIRKFEAVLAEYRFALPPFTSFTPEDWANAGDAWDEVRREKLGWDVTDYGLGQFAQTGLALITLRNGAGGTKPYAEKIMLSGAGQVCPLHFHWTKTEDIINRGGGELMFVLYNADEDGQRLDTPVCLQRDGRRVTVAAGEPFALRPGESLTLQPRCYHAFWGGAGDVLVGEVSSCNDDEADNRFFEPIGRFPAIEEDEAPYRLLCTEYPPAR